MTAPSLHNQLGAAIAAARANDLRGVAAMDEDSIDVRRIVGLLRRRLRLILVTMAAVTALTCIVVFSLQPIYSASTLVLVDTSHKNLLDPQDQYQSGSSDSARVDSEVELVGSDSNLLNVIDQLHLLNDPEFGVKLDLQQRILAFLRLQKGDLPTGQEAVASVLGGLRHAVDAQRVGLTFLISIQAYSLSPEKAATLANAVANSYIRSQLDAKINSALQARDTLQARLTDASATVAKTEGAFDAFVNQNIDSIVRTTGRTDLSQLRQQIADANAQRTKLASLEEAASRSWAVHDYKALAASLQSQALQALEAQRDAIQAQITAGNATQNVDLQGQLADIDRKLADTANQALGSLRQSISAKQASATDLGQQLRTLVVSADLPSDMLTKVYEIQQEAGIARSQYQNLLSRMKDLDTQANLQISDSRIVSEAMPSAKPTFPNTPQILALALVASAALGVVFALIYENYVGGITSSGQLEAVLRLPSSSVVPRARASRTGEVPREGGLAALLGTAPFSSFSEAIRSIRIAIDQKSAGLSNDPARKGRMIVVTSAIPAEGKTTLALSLARAYAVSNIRTLIIDADLRRPQLHEQLGLPPSTGLVAALREGRRDILSTLVQDDPVTPLKVVVGAMDRQSPTDQLVSGPAFADLLATARDQYDVVILDTAPIIPIVDTQYLLPAADVVTFVIAAGTTPQRVGLSALNKIRASLREGTEIVGVLNGATEDEVLYPKKYRSYYQAY